MAYIGVPPADRTSGARVRDEFTADGTQVCFQLSQEVPGSFESNIIAVVENVIQEPVTAYTIIDTVTVALTSISGTFTKNETVTGGTSSATGKVIQVNLNNIVVRVLTGTFQNAETVTGGTSSATATVSSLTTNVGRGLLFSGTPTNGVAIYVLHQNAATYQVKPAAGSVTPETLSENLRTFTVDKFTATSSQTTFTLSTTPVSVKSILVFVDGVMQTETTHYTLSGAVVTMGSGLAAGQQVTVVHLGFSTVSRTAFADGSITTAMIADGAITSAKIADGGILTIDMADGSVTSLKIANGSIGSVDLADGSVTTTKIADTGVTAAKLASGVAVSNIGYTPVNKAGDTITGGTTYEARLTVAAPTGKQLTLAQWGDISGADGGQSTLAGNAYVDKATGAFTYSNSHGSIGATGIRFNSPSWNGGSIYTSGTTSATSGTTFTPVDLLGWNQTGVTGIKFAPTQVASSDANTLDDYEEGTWTPNISSNNGTGTFTTKVGKYTKIGNTVHIWFMCDYGNSLAAGTTQYLSGLPFPISTSIVNNTCVGSLACNGPAQQNLNLVALPSGNANVMYVYYGGGQVGTTISFAGGFATYMTN